MLAQELPLPAHGASQGPGLAAPLVIVESLASIGALTHPAAAHDGEEVGVLVSHRLARGTASTQRHRGAWRLAEKRRPNDPASVQGNLGMLGVANHIHPCGGRDVQGASPRRTPGSMVGGVAKDSTQRRKDAKRHEDRPTRGRKGRPGGACEIFHKVEPDGSNLPRPSRMGL